MNPRISMITLGVNDLKRSIDFYEHGLGFPRMDSPECLLRFLYERCTGCDGLFDDFIAHNPQWLPKAHVALGYTVAR